MTGHDLQKTTEFLKGVEKTKEFPFSKVYKPQRVIYKIDDCFMTQTVEKKDSKTEFKNLHNLMGENFPEYVDFYTEIIDDTVPVLDYMDYLRELKELSTKKFEKTAFRQLNRLFLKVDEYTVVTSCVVLGMVPGSTTIINEVYKNGKFVSASQYDLAEVIKNYAEITGRKIICSDVNPKNKDLRILR